MSLTDKFTVANTTVLVLDEFIKVFRTEIPQLRFVYSQDPAIGNTLIKYMDDNQLKENEEPNIFPLFSFRRGPLRWTDIGGPGRRHSTQIATMVQEEENQSYVYRTLHGEFDIDFVYLDSGVNRLEEFEILYLGNKGMSQENEITVHINDDLEDFKYYARYNELSDFFLSRENHHYQGVSGTVTVMGFYFIFLQAAPFITEINLRVENFWSEVLAKTTIRGIIK